MNSRTYEPPAMDTDGAELRLSGGPFPPGAFDHVSALVMSLYEALEPPPEIKKSVPVEKVKDVLWRSALAQFDDDAVEAERSYAAREVSIEAAGGVVPEQEQKVYDALDGLKDTIEAAVAAGIRFHLIRDE